MASEQKIKRIFIKSMKVSGWIILSVLILFVVAVLLIRLPSVQQKITQRAVQFLKGKIGTEVRLKRAFIGFPKKIIIEGLYLEDQTADTLLYVGELSIDADFWALTKNRIELNTIRLTQCTGNVKRAANDSAFNFSYIIDAFADSTTSAEADTTGSAWQFAIETIRLENINLLYNDSLTGDYIQSKTGRFIIDIDEIDPARSVYKINDIDARNIIAKIEQHKLPVAQPEQIQKNDSTTLPFDIGIKEITLRNIQFSYTQLPLKQSIQADLNYVYVDVNAIDLQNNLLDIDNIELNHSALSYNFHQPEQDKTSKPATQTEATPFTGLNIPWKIRINEISLDDNRIQYHNTALPVQKNVFDVNHVWLFGLQCSIDDVVIHNNEIQAKVKNLAFQERNGFNIQNFKTDFKLNNTSLNIKEFLLASGNSSLEFSGQASFPDISRYAEAKVNVAIPRVVVAVNDMLYFTPALLDSIPVTLPPQTALTLSAQLTGTVSDLALHKLTLQALKQTELNLHGHIKNLPDIDQAQLSFTLDKLHTTAADVYSIANDSLIPSSVQIPDWLTLTGSLAGTLKQPTFEALLQSSSGNMKAQGSLNLINTPTYTLQVNTNNLHIGKLLRQPETIGELAVTASVNGAGFTLDELNTNLNILISKFEYNQYTYTDIAMKGLLNRYLFSGDITSHDPNLDFTVQGGLDYTSDIPVYQLNANLTNADFQKLNLSEQPLKVRGGLEVNLATSDFRIINGNMGIYNVGIYNGESLYLVDSLLFASVDQAGKSSMTIESDIVAGRFEGTFNLFNIAPVMKQHFNRYFSMHDTSVQEFTTPQRFSFDLTLKNTDLITEILLPELDFVPGKIKGEFDSEAHKLNIEMNVAQIKYATTSLDSIAFNIQSNRDELTYRFRLKNILLDTLIIDALQLVGKVENDSIYTAFQILDNKNERKYVLGGAFKSFDDKFRFKFLPDQVKLNYDTWTVPEDNYLDLGKSGLVAHNFTLSKNQEQFALVTTTHDSTLAFEFNRFELANITQLVRGTIPASGALNGNLKFSTSGSGTFNSKLLINALHVLEKPVGDVSLELAHTANRYNINMSIQNEGSNVTATGYYLPDENNPSIQLTTSLEPLNLRAIEAFSFGQLQNVTGIATGKIFVSGALRQPNIRGNITFRDAAFKSTYLNSNFALQHETITFDETGIVFKNFTINDQSKKNNAVMDGSILTKNYNDFRFNLRLNTKNFQVLNTQAEDNDMFYGNVKIHARAQITGSMNRPRVDVTLGVSPDTELTYIVPQSQKSVMEQKGIVEFVDKDAYKDPFLKDILLADTARMIFTGMDLTANLELTDKETFHVVIDPATGDKLSINGNANLTLNMNPSGNMSLSGRYEVTKGTYNFSFYKFVKRDFEIVKGGSLMWSGDPLNARIDLRASHRVETSPVDLIARASAGTPDPRYQQRLPFLVYLDMKGQLLAPEISFSLDMPDDKKNSFSSVYTILQDINTRESDVNKQVFALLILRRFISDNPFESQGGSDIANTTRTSVSRLLSDQLNRLSENVKGIELSVDIKSYEDHTTTEAQGNTHVQLGVSKSLFNDRLVVKLSGNVDVEGDDSKQGNVTDYIGDLALEYKITRDGRFRITGFRTSNYDMIDGELIETGAGLIYIKDYNTLKELFKANAK